jgi:hypothetical protein
MYVGFSNSWPVHRICGILFNRFYRLEIHSFMVCIFHQLVNCCPYGRRNFMVLVYCCPSTVPSLWPPPPSPPSRCIQFIQTVCDLWEGGGGVLKCTVDHILQEFYTLFLTRFKTTKLLHYPKQKWPVKTTLRDWCLWSSFVHAVFKEKHGVLDPWPELTITSLCRWLQLAQLAKGKKSRP